jgi:hypothetical protein
LSTNFEILRTLTHEQAVEYVGTTFRLMQNGEPAAGFDLVAVERLMPDRPRSKRMKRDPFSLYFSGPAEPLLPQGMYDLQSEAITLNGLFLVPIGRNEDGRYEYEAVFT